MSKLDLTGPLTFAPIFQERIWGGTKLAQLFAKKLPAGKRIGESWEIVDRPEAQSVVQHGVLRGQTLHQLWTEQRRLIFGDVPEAARFPLLVKLLDAQETLSLQVHPPVHIAPKLAGEPKTEFWYVVAAERGAKFFAGFREEVTRDEFENVLRRGSTARFVHEIAVRSGDAMFLPAGRFHALGAGIVLVEIQQNSDTTYRVFDWNRVDEQGKSRTLHVEQALASIDFADVEPELIEPRGELLVSHESFEVEKWNLDVTRQIAPEGQFAIVCCLSGSIGCGEMEFRPGEFFLVAAHVDQRKVKPITPPASLLRITVPAALV